MLFGVCADLEKAPAVRAAGFDYLEPPLNKVAAYPENEFAERCALVESTGLPCPSFSLLYPKTLQLLGPETTETEITQYLHTAFARMERLGGKIAVFGSGKSRSRPDAMPYADALRRLIGLFRLTGAIAAQYGVTVVAEPLNRAECNMLNSMAEAAALCAAVDRPNVRMLTDYYHVMKDGEPLGDIGRLGDFAHAHIAAKAGRRYPLQEQGEDYRRFFEELKAIGYAGNMSVEGKTEDMAADGPLALALLRQIWREL